MPYLEVPTRGRNFAEGGPLASKQGSLDSTEKKVEKYTCMRMWISILKPEIAENHSEKGTKQKLSGDLKTKEYLIQKSEI